jgi:hypothetical protein
MKQLIAKIFSKEPTTTFRKEWALSVNNKDNKPFKDPMYGNKVRGKININHYITYNIVRGLRLDRGFNNPDNYDFKMYIYRLNQVLKGRSPDWFVTSFIKDCLFPFNGTITEKEFKEKANEAIRLYSGS